MGRILTTSVAVELQLCSDPLFSMSVTHLEFGLSARKSLLSRFSYLWTCWPICTHFLVLRISGSKSYFFMIRSTVLGFLWSPYFFNYSHNLL